MAIMVILLNSQAALLAEFSLNIVLKLNEAFAHIKIGIYI